MSFPPSCQIFLCSLLLLGALSTDSSGGEPNKTGARLTSSSAALGEVFDDAHVSSHGALQVHLLAAGMAPDERYQFLSEWVLPSDQHDSLRMQIDFTQSYPPPVLANGEPGPGRMIPSGGELIAPAIDLVIVATELHRLPDIQRVAENWRPADDEDRKSRIAFLSLVSIAQQDFPAAERLMRELLKLAGSLPVRHAERCAETAVVWFAENHGATRELARDLAVHLYEDTRTKNGQRSERWIRQMYARKYLLDAAQVLPKDSEVDVESTRPLRNWISASRMTSESRGTGCPQSVWKTSPGSAAHVAGHDHDYLYFASPLTGDFSIEADLNTFAYRDIHLAFGSHWAGSRHDRTSCVNGDFRYDGRSQPLKPLLTRMFDWMRVRIDIRDNTRTTFINGRKVFQLPHPSGSDPWLAIHSWWNMNGTVKNLRIIGDPIIPEQIELTTQYELPGWLPYFDETVGGPRNDWYLQSSSDTPTSQGHRELIGRRRPELVGTHCESLVRYHRPMAEDGTIEYEFYYEPQQSLVHPALDRLSFLMQPGGVAIHWITDGKYDQTGLDPANQTAETRDIGNDDPLPLNPAQWNRVSLTIHDDTVDIVLNNQPVFSRVLESTNLRTFGLFHYADQTEAKVRNVRWKGQWPRELAEPEKQELASDELEKLLGDSTGLPLVLEHDFRQGLPRDRFSIAGGGWEDSVRQEPNGICMSRPGGHYTHYVIATPLTLSGDFDVTASIQDFESSVMEGGEGNVQLTAVFADSRFTECNLMRKRYLFTDQREEQLIQTSVMQKRNGETAYSVPPALAEESNSGRMRLARRGIQLYFLYAEDDSPEFRLVHQEQVGADDAVIKLVVGHHLSGSTSVIWENLTIRAQASSGLPETPWPTIAELDAQRAQLAAKVRFDFSSTQAIRGTAGLDQFQIWGYPTAAFLRDNDGLRIDVPGSDEWQAAGLLPRMAIDGDFDISLNLETIHFEPCAAANESTVLLQTEFNNPQKNVSEIKYSIHNDGHRAAETQVRRVRPDGTFEYQELQTSKAAGAYLLRLARRGKTIYQIFQESDDTPPVILGAMTIGTDPVPDGCLRSLVHTGGANRKTVVRFRSLSIDAEKIDRP